jgi:hypothetical protein
MNIEREIAKLVHDLLKSQDNVDYSPEWGSVLYELNRLRSAERYAKQAGDLDEDMKSELYTLMTTTIRIIGAKLPVFGRHEGVEFGFHIFIQIACLFGVALG